MTKFQLEHRGGTCGSIFFLTSSALVYTRWGGTDGGLYAAVVLLLMAGLGLTGRRALWVNPDKESIYIVYLTLFTIPWNRTSHRFEDFKAVIMETSIDDAVRKTQGTERKAWYHEVELVGVDNRCYLTRFDELGKAVAFSEKLARVMGLEYKEAVGKSH